MNNNNLYDQNAHRRTDRAYDYPSGSYIEFFSVDDSLKVRGPGRDILFVNELNLIDFDTFIQLLLRTKICAIGDFNPADEFHWIYDELLAEMVLVDGDITWYRRKGTKKTDKPDVAFIKSTYLDNPFLPHEQVKEIENLKNVDSNFWRIYGEGERGHSEGVIYTHWQPYGVEQQGVSVFGLDFGYNNPTALLRVSENDQNLYWKEEIYQSHLTNSDLIPMLKQIVKPHEIVYCDTAEPARITDIGRAGIRVLPANKDVKLGIDFVKSRKLYIHSGSVNLLKEIKSYKYMDQGKRKGNEPEVPLKLNDHCFVGWTSVETSEGPKEIDQIKEFDLVHTTQGLKTVLKVWDNGTQLTKHYTLHFDTFVVYFRCTPDHLFYTTEGWKKISELKQGMTVSLINTSEDESLSYNPEKGIFEVTNEPCTSTSGLFIMAKDLRATTYITKTKTPGIIGPETLNSRNQVSIYQNTVNQESKTIRSGLKSFKKQALSKLKNGIKAMKDYFGIRNTEKEHGLTGNIKNASVYYAGESIQLDIPENQSTAIQTVKLRRIVEGHTSFQRVYDLTVEDAHEYFANGLLVHNCMDAGRYASLHFKKAKTGLNMSFHR